MNLPALMTVASVIVMPQLVYMHLHSLLDSLYEEEASHRVNNLALMATGLILGRHVQLWEIALHVPLDIQLTSITRRFERFVADEDLAVKRFFAPFVSAMVVSLGNERACLILDCTQAGPKCRVVMVALAYHGTVLPVAWRTVAGGKGHVTGQIQRDLLREVSVSFRHCRQVLVLGDAEYSNETLISFLRSQPGWSFVFRVQDSYHMQPQNRHWDAIAWYGSQSGIQPGQVRHWPDVLYTKTHQLSGLTVTMHWGEGETEPLYLVSNLSAADTPHLLYEMRAWIETLFGNHKSRGFQLQRTQMEIPSHIDRLVLVIAIVTCITLGLGTHLCLSNMTHLIDRTDRRDLSLFQLGWRWLHRLITFNRLHELRIVFRWTFALPPPGFQTA
jgi:hypothetical protein